MSSTAPNVDAWLNFRANQPSKPSQKKLIDSDDVKFPEIQQIAK
jgi:hypothetical protein